MAITTLRDYYKSKGQNLPTLKDRAKIFEQHGLGSATGYQGTYDQNVSLLNRLNTIASQPKPIVPAPVIKPPTPVPAAPVPAAPAAPASPNQDTYTGLYDRLKKDFGLDTLISSIKGAFTTQPKKADLYSTELANTGVDKDQTELNSLDSKISSIDSALSQSDKDIRDRINQSGGIVTDSQVQRLVAQEKAPLIDQYRTLTGARGTLANRITKSEARASNMANLKYSDAMQPYENAKTELATINPIFGTTLSMGEKDLANRLSDVTKKEKDAQAKNKTITDQDKAMGLKGYKTVNPADVAKLNATGKYDTLTINGRSYAKAKPMDKLTEYEAKKQIEAKYKKPTTKKTPTTKNYTGTTIPGSLKNEIITNIQAGAKQEDVMKTYSEVDTNYIKSLYPKKNQSS